MFNPRGADVADPVSVRTRVPLPPRQRICTHGSMGLSINRPETTSVIFTVTPGSVKPCVLCGYEVSIGEIWPDNKGGRERWVCRGCRYRLARHLRKCDTGGDVGCSGKEARPEEKRAGSDSLVPDGVAVRIKCVSRMVHRSADVLCCLWVALCRPGGCFHSVCVGNPARHVTPELDCSPGRGQGGPRRPFGRNPLS